MMIFRHEQHQKTFAEDETRANLIEDMIPMYSSVEMRRVIAVIQDNVACITSFIQSLGRGLHNVNANTVCKSVLQHFLSVSPYNIITTISSSSSSSSSMGEGRNSLPTS